MMSVSRRKVLQGGVAIVVGAAVPLAPRLAWAGAAATLDLATFKRLVGSTFQASVNGTTVSLRLASATQQAKPTKKGECFSLLFEGSTRFAQGGYSFQHPSLGSFPLFVVPVTSPGSATTTYEAIFNRI